MAANQFLLTNEMRYFYFSCFISVFHFNGRSKLVPTLYLPKRGSNKGDYVTLCLIHEYSPHFIFQPSSKNAPTSRHPVWRFVLQIQLHTATDNSFSQKPSLAIYRHHQEKEKNAGYCRELQTFHQFPENHRHLYSLQFTRNA